MQLKRIYDHDAPKEKWSIRTEMCRECVVGKVVNAAGDGVENCLVCGGDGQIRIEVPPVSGITVLRAGLVQRFTQHFINGALKEGWLSIGEGQIRLEATPEALVYRIVRVPGAYCCHCDEPVAGGASAAAVAKSMEHVTQAHLGAASPDPINPAGYRTENCYTAVLEEGAPIELEEATAMDKQVREALAEKVQQKYGAVARRDADGGDTDG